MWLPLKLFVVLETRGVHPDQAAAGHAGQACIKATFHAELTLHVRQVEMVGFPVRTRQVRPPNTAQHMGRQGSARILAHRLYVNINAGKTYAAFHPPRQRFG